MEWNNYLVNEVEEDQEKFCGRNFDMVFIIKSLYNKVIDTNE